MTLKKQADIEAAVSSEEEWADYDEVKVTKGVEYAPGSKNATEWIERNTHSPCTIIDQPWPNDAWRGCAEMVKDEIRKTVFPELRDSRMWVMMFFLNLYKSKVEGRRPAHEQMAFMDMMRATDSRGFADPESMRCFKDTVYLWQQNEYMARSVG